MKKGLLFLTLILFSANLLAQNNFRSRQSGNWNDSNTWEEETSPGVWDNTANFPDFNDGIITLSTGYSVNIPNGFTVTVDQIEYENDLSGDTGILIIDSGGTMIVNDGTGDDIRLLNDFTTFALLEVNGVIRLEQGATIVEDDYDNLGIGPTGVTGDTFKVRDGGEYQHNYTSGGGAVPAADWQIGSTCRIFGASTISPSNLSASTFYNFIWEGTGQSGIIDFNSSLSDILGDFEILTTNGNILRLASGSTLSLIVGNDFLITGNSRVQFATTNESSVNIGRDLIIESTNTSTNTISTTANSNSNISVGRNFLKQNNSILSLGAGPSSFTSIEIKGNYSHLGGAISRSTSGSSEIVFNGSTLQSFNSEIAFPSSNIINIIIENNTIVNFESVSFLRTDGAFTVQSSAKIILRSNDASGALQNNTTGGNIRVSGTRTYQTGSIIEYNGTSTQSIGNGFPASGVDLIINNSNGVNLSGGLTISSGRTLTLQEGSLNIGSNTLTLNGTVSTVNGGITGGSLSNMEIGGTGNFGTLGFVGSNQLNNFTLNRTSSGNVTLGDNLEILGTLTQSAGNLTLNGNTLTINGDYDQTGGSLIFDNAATLNISGAGTLPASLAASGNLNTLNLDRAASTLTIGASFELQNLNLISGELDNVGTLTIADAGQITREASGSITNAVNAAGTYDLNYNNASAISTGPEFIASSTAINNFTKQGSGSLTLNANRTINGDITLSNGSFNASTHTLTINGDYVSNAPSSLESATVIFDGNTTISGSTALTFGNLTVSGTLNPTSNLNINGNLTNNGTLNSSSGTATFGGTTAISGSSPVTFNNLVVNGSLTASSTETLGVNGNFTNDGTFDANGGTVVFSGTSSILGSNNPTFHNIAISGTLNSPTTLNLSGGLTNNGTFTHNNGTVNFNGSGTRAIAGSSVTPFYNLEATGGTLQVNGQADIHNVLTLGASTTFDADGTGSGITTLKSSSVTQSAAIAAIPSGSSVSGNISVERYILGGRGYSNVGFPLNGATVAQVQVGIPINGTFTGASNYNGLTAPSTFSYAENVGGGIDDGWSSFPSSANTENWILGEGYSVFRFTGTADATITARGTLVDASSGFSRALSYTSSGNDADDGWHLVANPFAAATDWAEWTKTNVAGNAAYVWNKDANGGLGAYSTLTGAAVIPQGQAFFVKVTSSGSLAAGEASKVTGSSATFYDEIIEEDFLKISLSNSNYTDVARVYWNEQASDNYDGEYDVLRMKNGGFTLSMATKDNRYVKHNHIAPLATDNTCNKSFFINLENMGNSGKYSLRFENLATFGVGELLLVDHYTNQSTVINEGQAISFSVDENAASKNGSRFELVLEEVEPALALDYTYQNEICIQDDWMLQIHNAKAGFSYQLLQNDSTWFAAEGTNANLEIVVQNADLASSNEFQLVVTSNACESSYQEVIQVQKVAEVNTALAIDEYEFCPSLSSLAVELPTQASVNYRIQISETESIEFVGDGTNKLIDIEKMQLQEGLNQFEIFAYRDNCEEVKLEQNLNIDLLQTPNTDLAINTDLACYDQMEVFTSMETENGVRYSVYYGESLLHEFTGTGQVEEFSFAKGNWTTDSEVSLTVLAANNECAAYELNQAIVLNYSAAPAQVSNIIDDNICQSASAQIQFTGELGTDYSLRLNNEELVQLTATSNEVSVDIAAEKLSIGENLIAIYAKSADCGWIDLGQVISVNQSEALSLEAEQTLSACFDEELIVSTDAIEGANYEWYNEQNELINSTSTASLTLNNVVETSTLFVKAISEQGCESNLSTIQIAVNKPEQVEQIQHDVACESDLATVSFTSKEGVSYSLRIAENELVQASGNGGTLVMEVNSDLLQLGENQLTLFAKWGDCKWVDLNQQITIELVEPINKDVGIFAENICAQEDIEIQLDDLQAGATYSLIYQGAQIATQVAESESMTIHLVGHNYAYGELVFDLAISKETCGEVLLENAISINHFDQITLEEVGVQEVCFGQDALLSVNEINGAQYEWYDSNDNLIATTSVGELSIENITSSANYSVQAITANGCQSNRVGAAIDVVELAKPSIQFIDNLLLTEQSADNYQWYLNDEPIDGANSASIEPTENGQYRVEVFVNGCSEISDSFLLDVLSAAELSQIGLRLYPNPVVDQLIINFDDMNLQSGSIYVYNLNGKIIAHTDYKEQLDVKMSAANWQQGVYMVVLVNKDRVTKFKIVKK